MRSDLQVTSLRGNVETRLNQALEGQLDAVMLAWSGLHRLGLEQHVTQRLDPSDFLPAVGQGALGIECRCDDLRTRELLSQLDDPVTHRAVLAERAVLSALQGGCNLPLAAWARDVLDDKILDELSVLAISAAVFDPDGHKCVTVGLQGRRDEPESLGYRAAQACATRVLHRL